MTFPAYEPRDGAVIHLNPRNCWQLPAGRYVLEHWQGRAWQLCCTRQGDVQAIYAPDLAEEVEAGTATPIDPGEIERNRQALELRRLAPLRGRRAFAQSDVDGLALFDAHRSPKLEI